MKKIFTLLAAATLAVSANAESVILSWDGSTLGQYAVNGETDQDNLLTWENGFKMAISSRADKAYSSASSLTINDETYKTIKLSNGATNTLFAPEGYVITNLVIYDYINFDRVKKGGDGRVCYWKEVAGLAYTEETATILKDYIDIEGYGSTPDKVEFAINKLNEVSFTQTGEQLCVVIDVTYEKGGNDDPAPAEGVAFTTTGNGSGTFGKTFDSIVTPFEFDAATMTGTFKNFLGSNTTVELKWTITNENKKPEETGAIFDAEPVSGLGEIQTVAGYYKMCAINDFTGSVIFKQDGVNFGKLDNVLLGVGFSSQIEVVTIDGARYHEVNLMLGGDYSKWDAEKSEWVASGQNYFKLVKNIPMSGDTSAIEAIEAADENAPVEYYNIQGMRVNEPAAGQLLIRRQGSKVSKVIIR